MDVHEYLYRNIAAIEHKHIVVCGLGSLGAPAVESFVRMGMRRVTGIDYDRVSKHNLSNQPWSIQDIGTPKTKVLAGMLARSTRQKMTAVQQEITATNAHLLLQGADIIVDALDNGRGRRAVAVAASDLGIACLHMGMGGDSTYGLAQWNDAFPIPDDDANGGVDGCEYPLTRTLSVLLSQSAVELVLQYLCGIPMRGVEVLLPEISLRARNYP